MADYLTCPHRGRELRFVNGPQCGCDRLVYECALHKLCLKKIPAGWSREKFGPQMDGVTVCATECDDWKL